tara:strand:- start:32036 stop:33400 length:1365 start_codon:yes stop_codon:yes gene_type:complete
MATQIATVNIALRTATVSRAGFGTPIFISSHRAFLERVRTYNNLTAVAQDFETDSPAYIAAQGLFASSPSPAQIKIGRREASMVLTPNNVANGTQYTVTVAVNDGDAVAVSYTATTGNTAEDVVDAIVAAIAADADVSAHVTVTKNGTGDATTVTLAPTTTADTLVLSSLTNLSQSGVSTETAADVLQQVRNADDDFYFVTADDHDSTFVLDMAAAVQALEKLYFVSTQEQSSIDTPYSVSSSDILASLVNGGFTRTAGFWSHDADSKYRECNFVGANAPYSPDQRAVIWANISLPGVPVALDTSVTPNLKLTATQQTNLDNRNASYVKVTLAGNRVTDAGGKVASGQFIDEMRILDNMTARVREGQVALFANQAGGKVPGNANGIALSRAALANSLNPFVASTAIDGYTIDVSNAVVDAASRTLTGMTFDANLSGGIVRVVINGNLTSQNQGV